MAATILLVLASGPHFDEGVDRKDPYGDYAFDWRVDEVKVSSLRGAAARTVKWPTSRWCDELDDQLFNIVVVAAAKNNLGVLYAQGLGVPKDHVQALSWFLLAAGQGSGRGASNGATLAANMQAAEIAEAERLADNRGLWPGWVMRDLVCSRRHAEPLWRGSTPIS